MNKMTMYIIGAIICAAGQIVLMFLVNSEGRKSALEEFEKNITIHVDKLPEKIKSNLLDTLVVRYKISNKQLIDQFNKKGKGDKDEIIDKLDFINQDLKNKSDQIGSLEIKASKQNAKTEKVIAEIEKIQSEDEFSNEHLAEVFSEIEKGYTRYFKGQEGCISVVPNQAYPNSLKIAEDLNSKLIEQGFQSQLVQSVMNIPQREKRAEIYNKMGSCMTLLVNFK